jgi:hypothetical protein
MAYVKGVTVQLADNWAKAVVARVVSSDSTAMRGHVERVVAIDSRVVPTAGGQHAATACASVQPAGLARMPLPATQPAAQQGRLVARVQVALALAALGNANN